MVEKITVTITSELTRYGEVEFSVKSHKGIFKSKCLHDALSYADIKMTGISDMVDSTRRRMKSVNHFSLETRYTRLYDQNRETEKGDAESINDSESATEHSIYDIPVKHRKGSKSGTKRREAVLS